jgi:hypothetical protein
LQDARPDPSHRQGPQGIIFAEKPPICMKSERFRNF